MESNIFLEDNLLKLVQQHPLVLFWPLPYSECSNSSKTIKVGLVGIGGRGSGAAAQAMAADDNVALTAIGDMFEDPLNYAVEFLKPADVINIRLLLKQLSQDLMPTKRSLILALML